MKAYEEMADLQLTKIVQTMCTFTTIESLSDASEPVMSPHVSVNERESENEYTDICGSEDNSTINRCKSFDLNRVRHDFTKQYIDAIPKHWSSSE